jgi:hypothetical protein
VVELSAQGAPADALAVIQAQAAEDVDRANGQYAACDSFNIHWRRPVSRCSAAHAQNSILDIVPKYSGDASFGNVPLRLTELF